MRSDETTLKELADSLGFKAIFWRPDLLELQKGEIAKTFNSIGLAIIYLVGFYDGRNDG